MEIASSSTRPRPDNIVKAINTVRKANNKVSKLKADQHSKEQCWTAYVQNMQQAFTTERRKHVAAMEKLTQDLEEAKALQLSSREALAQAAVGAPKSSAQIEPAAEAEWLQLMGQCPGQDAESMEVDPDAIGRQVSELLQPPRAAADACPMFGAGGTPAISGGAVPLPALNMQAAFNHLSPGLGDAIAAANAKKETARAGSGNSGPAPRRYPRRGPIVPTTLCLLGPVDPYKPRALGPI